MKKNQLKKVIAYAICMSTAIASWAGPWTKKADNVQFSVGRWGAMSFTVNNKIYITGGYANMSYQNDVQAYDPTTNAWTVKNNPPGAPNRSSGVAFVINGKAYLGLGAQDFISISGTQKNLTDLWEYNATNDTWTQKASLPDSGRTDLSVFVANNKAYIVGGAGKFGGSITSTNQVWEYDPASNKWTKKADYPETSVTNSSAFGINGKGYVTCGRSGTTNLKKTYEYNPSTNVWTPKADFIDSARYGAVSFVLNNRGYVGLGSTSYTGYKSTFFFYDPVTDKWGYLPGSWSAQGRLYGIAEVVNNIAYTGCGWRLDGSVQTFFRDWHEGDINAMLDVNDIKAEKAKLMVYPNPAQGELYIDMAPHTDNYSYTIYSITGQRTATGIVPRNNRIEISQIPAGQYVLEVATPKETLQAIIILSK